MLLSPAGLLIWSIDLFLLYSAILVLVEGSLVL